MQSTCQYFQRIWQWSTKKVAIIGSLIKTNESSQATCQEFSMHNQDMSTQWSTHQTPGLLHLKFKFDLLWSPVESPFCGPRILYKAISTWWRARFLFKMILFIKKIWLGVATYFCFIFKRVNKIRKKTLSATPYFGKSGLWKNGSGSGVRLLIRKVR